MERYIIIDRSCSGHCCFNYTIVDTSEGYAKNSDGRIIGDDKWWEKPMCECFEEEEAKLIAKALNLLDKENNVLS